MTNSVNLRELVLGMLIQIIEEENYSHIVIKNTLTKYQYLEKQDRAFIQRLLEGTVEMYLQLDYIINQFSKIKTNKMKPVIRNILRMGVYQIKFMDSVPDSAACNEAVKLATKKGFYTLKGFVNGILRNVSRNLETIEYPKEEKEPIKYLSIQYSIPEWIIKDWVKEYDINQVKKMASATFNDKETSIRTNLTKITSQKLEEKLVSDGITVRKSAYFDYAFNISGYNYLNKIQSFLDGEFQVQDASSMLVAEVACIKEGDTVIDVCAAPGGKTLHIAEKLNGTGKVISRDVSEYKTDLIEDNVKRLGFTNIEVMVSDATVLDESSIEKADVVIADLPCSGLGVFAKKTDIKYKMTKEKQEELVQLQRKMLSTVSKYVKMGGTLIYSTCTINKEENYNNVIWLLEQSDFKLESIDSYIPRTLKCDTTGNGYIQLLPGVHESDGFFIARLVRK